MKFLIVKPSQPSFILGPNIRLGIIFSNTLSLRSFIIIIIIIIIRLLLLLLLDYYYYYYYYYI